MIKKIATNPRLRLARTGRHEINTNPNHGFHKLKRINGGHLTAENRVDGLRRDTKWRQLNMVTKKSEYRGQIVDNKKREIKYGFLYLLFVRRPT